MLEKKQKWPFDKYEVVSMAKQNVYLMWIKYWQKIYDTRVNIYLCVTPCRLYCKLCTLKLHIVILQRKRIHIPKVDKTTIRINFISFQIRPANYEKIPLAICSHVWGLQGCCHQYQSTLPTPNLQDIANSRWKVNIYQWSAKDEKQSIYKPRFRPLEVFIYLFLFPFGLGWSSTHST